MESTRAITEMILQEAQNMAEHIIQEAKNAAESMLEKQRQLGVKRADEVACLLLKKAEGEAEVIKLHSIADAKLKANCIILSKKEAWIDKVINEAKNKLEILAQSDEYLLILEKLIIGASVVLGGGNLEVLLNERDSSLPLKLGDIAKKISEKTGFKTKLRLSEEKLKVIGGAVVKTANGKVIMDNTFDDILRRREKDLRFEIAKILF